MIVEMDFIDSSRCPTPRPRDVKKYAPGSANDIFSYLGPGDTLEALSNFRGPDPVYDEPDPVLVKQIRRAKRHAARATVSHEKKTKSKTKFSSRQLHSKHPQRSPHYSLSDSPANYQIYDLKPCGSQPESIKIIKHDIDLESISPKSEFDILLEDIQRTSSSIDEVYDSHRKSVDNHPRIHRASLNARRIDRFSKPMKLNLTEKRLQESSSSTASTSASPTIASPRKISTSPSTDSSRSEMSQTVPQTQLAEGILLTKSQENLEADAAKAKEEHVNMLVKRLVPHVDSDPGLIPLMSMLGLRSSMKPPTPPPHAEGTVPQSSVPMQQRYSVWKDEARMTWKETGNLPDNYELLEKIDEVLELYKELDNAPTINIDDNAIHHLEKLADFYEEQAETNDRRNANQSKIGKTKIPLPPARTESNRIVEAYDQNVDFKDSTLKRASDLFRILQAPRAPGIVKHNKPRKSSHGQIMENISESESEESVAELDTPNSPLFGFDDSDDGIALAEDEESVLSQLLEEYGVTNSKEDDKTQEPIVHDSSNTDENTSFRMLSNKKPLPAVPDAILLPEQEYSSDSSLVTRTWTVLRQLTIPGLEAHEINDLQDMTEEELIVDNYLAVEQDVFQWNWQHLNGPTIKNWDELPGKTRGMFERISPEVISNPEAAYQRSTGSRVIMMVQMLGQLLCEIHEDNYLFGLSDDDDRYMRDIADEMLRGGQELPYKIWDIGFVGKTVVKDTYIESFARKVGLLAFRLDQYTNPIYPPTEDNMYPKRRLGTLRDIIMRFCLFQNELRKHQAIYEFDFLIGQEIWRRGWMRDLEEADFIEREIDLNGENWEQEALKYKVTAVVWPALTIREPDSKQRRVLVPAKVLLENKRVNKHERMRAAGLPSLEGPPVRAKPLKRVSN